MSDVLSPKELAHELKWSTETVRRWIRNGWLIARRLPNGRYVIDRQEAMKATR